MTKEEAIKLLIQVAHAAQKAGLFDLAAASQVIIALNVLQQPETQEA